MKKVNPTKLSLNRQTVRVLDAAALHRAAGAAEAAPTQGCSYGLTCTYSAYCTISCGAACPTIRLGCSGDIC